MTVEISDAIIKHYLRNVLFINGTAYAGKSTMVAMLAQRYDLVHCRENYHFNVTDKLVTPDKYPNLGYFQTMKDWQEFIGRTPEEYEAWIDGSTRELVEFEIAELMHVSAARGASPDKRPDAGTMRPAVIVDTNLPVDVLWRIADYRQVAIMLSPQSMSVERFFDRSDPEKQFILSKVAEAKDPEEAMRNQREWIARINSRERYDAFAGSGFFTIVREYDGRDTREETLARLAAHFGL